jgi:regulatory protein
MTDATTPEAYELALRFLAVRAHSEQELIRKLRQRACADGDIDLALERLRELGYVDDVAYAGTLVRRRAGHRSRAAIVAELAAKGVDRAIAVAATEDLDRDDQLATARRLAAGWPPLTPERVAGRLQRRGFPPDVVYAVLEERRGGL